MRICQRWLAVLSLTSPTLLAAAVLAAPFAVPAFAQQTPAATAPAKLKPKPAAKPAAPAAAAPSAKPMVPPAMGGAQPTLLGSISRVGRPTRLTPGGKKVCFTLAKPASPPTLPRPNRPRDPTYMFVSSRPTEKVKDEVSVIFGYGLKPNTDANIEISGANYLMYTQADGAWIKNAAEETRPRRRDARRPSRRW